MSEELTENNEILTEINVEKKEDTNLNPSKYYSIDGEDIKLHRADFQRHLILPK